MNSESRYSQGKSTLKLNPSTHEKYKYGHLGRWYIKLTLFKSSKSEKKFLQKIK